MRLNLINTTRIVAGALANKHVPKLTARFGEVSRVDDNAFKFSAVLDPGTNIMVQRINLADLFDGIPLDISDKEFNTPPVVGEFPDCIAVKDGFKEEPMLTESMDVYLPAIDVLGQMFEKWKRLVGLSGLPRIEVDLSTLDDYLTVDARDSVVYCGLVRIKYK